MRTRSGWIALLAVVLGLLALAEPVTAAPTAGGESSVSDTTPQPGQAVTVSASGLLPNGDVVIDYMPDGARLSVFKNGADGSFSRVVQIPATTYDGKKQIWVTALDAAGKFTRLKTDLTMSGPPANVELSDMSLVPSQVVRVTGDRWYAGATVLVVMFPEGVDFGPITADREGNFSKDVRLPKDLLNGKHGVQVFGRAAGGRMANIKLYPTVSGGYGSVGSIEFPDPLNPSSTTSTSSTVPRSTTTVRRTPLPPVDTGSSNIGTIALILGCLILLIAVALGWWYSSEGKAWRRNRATLKQARRKH